MPHIHEMQSESLKIKIGKGQKLRWIKWFQNNPMPKRFWDRVDKNGPIPSHIPELGACWTWKMKAIDGGGYGIMRVRDIGFEKNQKSHRLAWFLTHGPIPAGLWVLHKCDNTLCCNPNHLFLGNYYDNHRDSIQKGRQPVVNGSRHVNSKLTEKEVLEIRRLKATGGINQPSLAIMFGVGQDQISRIVNRKRWTHI